MGTVCIFLFDCAAVHKARSLKTRMREFGVEEIKPAESPKLNFNIKHLWDESTQSSSHPTLVPDLKSSNLVENLPRGVELVKAAKGGPTPQNPTD